MHTRPQRRSQFTDNTKPWPTTSDMSALWARLVMAAVAAAAAAADQPAVPVSSSYSGVSSNVASKASESAPSASLGSTAYTSGTAVSQGNLYYYYYPVAAVPLEEPYTGPSPSHGTRQLSYKPAKKKSDESGISSSSAHHYVQYDDYEEEDNLGPLLALLLVPLGFLLLLALFSSFFNGNNTNGLLGRSAKLDSKFGSMAELQAEIDLLLNKYTTALESDQCMERVVCELGVKASAIPNKELLFSLAEWLAPKHSILGSGRVSVLRRAATDPDYTMTTCKKYVCHPPAVVGHGIDHRATDDN